MQLKKISNPKGLVPLKYLFDKNDVARNMKVTPNSNEVEDYNIGTYVDPKIIKSSKALESEKKQRYITIMK